jgi:hypothetical protein
MWRRAMVKSDRHPYRPHGPQADHLDPDLPEIGRVVKNLPSMGTLLRFGIAAFEHVRHGTRETIDAREPMEPPIGYGAVDRSIFRSPIAKTSPEFAQGSTRASLVFDLDRSWVCQAPSRTVSRTGGTGQSFRD